MKHKGLAAKIREALRSLGKEGKEIESSVLAIKLDMVVDKEKQVLYRALRDFVKSGEVTQIRRGVCVYNSGNKPPQLQEIMWRYLRARKTVTIDDLVEISGASREYASEWVYMLARREIVEKIRLGRARKYRLISDPVVMPKDSARADRLMELRKQKKKEALAALVAVDTAVREAQKKILEIHD